MKTYVYYFFSFCITLVFVFSCQPKKSEEQDTWVDLFDGKSLDGWVMKEAEGNFFVKDGMIASITDSTSPNCYLAYNKNFRDFVLELDFMVEAPLNSGVQIRSVIRDEDATVTYMNGRMEAEEVTFPKGTAVGYQIEIDPSDRAWSGGLYEPGGRGWLQNLEGKPEAQKAYKKDGWNHFKIKAEGDHIQTWVNGVLAADARDSEYPAGFIGFQMHSAYNKEQEGKRMFWKNIKIREL